MTVHAPHADSHTHGLADDCPRCQEHALNPVSLDRSNRDRLLRGEIHTALDRKALDAVLRNSGPALTEED